MVDIETTPEIHAEVWGEGCLVHTNHYVLPEMMRFERSSGAELQNSMHRYRRTWELMEKAKGRIDLVTLQAVLRDHGNDPDSVCCHPNENRDYQTFASLIADLDTGRVEVAKGPPCQHEYHSYSV